MSKVESLGGHTLKGRFIALEPLEQRHVAGLIEAGRDPSIWTYMPYDVSSGIGPILDWHVKENVAGRMITFAVRRLADGALVGSTSFLNIVPAPPGTHRRRRPASSIRKRSICSSATPLAPTTTASSSRRTRRTPDPVPR